MKEIGTTILKTKAAWLAVVAFLFMIDGVIAQRPTHIPQESPPVGFFDSISNIFFYVIIPILILVFYLLWRANTKKERKKKEDNLRK